MSEQENFEAWLAKEKPSGDAEQVQRKWLDSNEYYDYLWSKDNEL
ncbi:hypothetical protein vBAspATola_22 [Aeromonas phage vB_AspA_Tola]|nr:hypothetical protein vBAspATola_22 [Aeromonas phage vB_AspA_Tola]